MTQAERVTTLLATKWQATLRESIKYLGGTVQITGNLVRLYSGGIIPARIMNALKMAMERHDQKKLLVITIAKKDRP